MTQHDVDEQTPDAPAGRPGRRRNNAANALLLAGAALAVAAVVVGVRTSGPTDATATSTWVADEVELESYAADLLAESNAAHVAAGLPAWEAADCAQPWAAERALGLVGADLEHAALDPVLAACAPLSTAGENLSRAAAPAADVVEAWMGSPGHRANLEDPTFTQAATACTWDGDQALCSLLLVGP
ncbi:CAP domain-containing protein [Cellulomonas dongxiuzhuiae]|uniref:CAP domain-containing protein n=1 Tax=Cellulomonas dongxiuzhuiae TaxID=2819979 RepID=UPI001AAED626|nr:CAP domain-containing protein [Cellulomonas dongxiuzhuiae]MBO3088812.1 hypothetical protein [Cellulomonas dongxiuzhuiae]